MNMLFQFEFSPIHLGMWGRPPGPPAPKHTPTPVEGAFDGRPLQHRESRFLASNAKFPFVHEQTAPSEFLTARACSSRCASELPFSSEQVHDPCFEFGSGMNASPPACTSREERRRRRDICIYIYIGAHPKGFRGAYGRTAARG